MVLVCNHPDEAIQLLDQLTVINDLVSYARLARLPERHKFDRQQLQQTPGWQHAVSTAQALCSKGAGELAM